MNQPTHPPTYQYFDFSENFFNNLSHYQKGDFFVYCIDRLCNYDNIEVSYTCLDMVSYAYIRHLENDFDFLTLHNKVHPNNICSPNSNSYYLEIFYKTTLAIADFIDFGTQIKMLVKKNINTTYEPYFQYLISRYSGNGSGFAGYFSNMLNPDDKTYSMSKSSVASLCDLVSANGSDEWQHFSNCKSRLAERPFRISKIKPQKRQKAGENQSFFQFPTFDEIPPSLNAKESLWDWLQKQKRDGK